MVFQTLLNFETCRWDRTLRALISTAFFPPCEKMQEQSSAYQCIKGNWNMAAMTTLKSHIYLHKALVGHTKEAEATSKIFLQRKCILKASLVAQMVKKICLLRGRPRFNPWIGKIPWRRKWLPTPVFLPGEFHGQRNLVGYSPWGCKELDTTEQLTLQWATVWHSGWLPTYPVSLAKTLASFKEQQKILLHWVHLIPKRLPNGLECVSLARSRRCPWLQPV